MKTFIVSVDWVNGETSNFTHTAENKQIAIEQTLDGFDGNMRDMIKHIDASVASPEDKLRFVKVDALGLLEQLALEFPGLLDGETDVDGGDLTNTITRILADNEELTEYLRG